MAVKRSGYRRSTKRKPFWEGLLEWCLGFGKKLIIPALLMWLVAWMWGGGLFAKGYDMARDTLISWTADKGLTVEDVVIEGRYRTDVSDLNRAIAVEKGTPVLSVDVDAIQARLVKLPWVKNVTVRRNYSGVIHVSMTERIPFVIWNRPGRGKAVVDTDGAIIKGANIDDFASLLVVSGVDAPKHTVTLMETVLAEPNVASHIRGAEWIGDRRWDLLSTGGTRIHLPEKDIGYALTRLARLQEEKNILDRGLLSIDLRVQDRIIIETERGEAHDAMTLSSADKVNAI